MSTLFEFPRVRTLARQVLPSVIEGSIIPVALFLVMLRVLGLWGAILVGLGWSYTAIVRRLVTHRPVPGIMIIGAATLTARTILALATGSSFVYFLQPTLGTALVAVAFLLSVPLGRPLAQRIASDFCPIPPEVLAHDHVKRLFLRISLLFAFTLSLNAGLALWLQVSQSVGTFVVVKSLASAVMTIAAVIVSIVWFKRSMRRQGLLAPATVRV
jgi:intracellular septation protein A